MNFSVSITFQRFWWFVRAPGYISVHRDVGFFPLSRRFSLLLGSDQGDLASILCDRKRNGRAGRIDGDALLLMN